MSRQGTPHLNIGVSADPRGVVVEDLQWVAFDGVESAFAGDDISSVFVGFAEFELKAMALKIAVEAFDCRNGGSGMVGFAHFLHGFSPRLPTNNGAILMHRQQEKRHSGRKIALAHRAVLVHGGAMTGFKQAVEKAGGPVAFQALMGIKRRTYFMWQNGDIPLQRYPLIAEKTGVPLHVLCPQHWPAPMRRKR